MRASICGAWGKRKRGRIRWRDAAGRRTHVCPSAHLSVFPPTCTSIHPFLHPPIHPTICPSIQQTLKAMPGQPLGTVWRTKWKTRLCLPPRKLLYIGARRSQGLEGNPPSSVSGNRPRLRSSLSPLGWDERSRGKHWAAEGGRGSPVEDRAIPSILVLFWSWVLTLGGSRPPPHREARAQQAPGGRWTGRLPCPLSGARTSSQPSGRTPHLLLSGLSCVAWAAQTSLLETRATISQRRCGLVKRHARPALRHMGLIPDNLLP